ncbi:MAG: alpha/beta fold hydrolase [Bdellovibrionales bacterium]
MFLHGLMGSGSNWRQVAKAFAEDYQVLTFDQRGHGRSHPPGDHFRPTDFAQDLRLILDELGWERIFLVGHSMGGRNALEFAWRFAHRVIGLVMEDIGPEAKASAMDRIRRLLDLVPSPFSSRAEARRFLLEEYPKLISFYPRPETVAMFLLTNIVEKAPGVWDWRFDKTAILAALTAGRQEDRWDAFQNLKCPVLVMRGENSTDLDRETFERMQRLLPSARAVEIPGAGHWVHFEQPDAFIRVVREFFLTCGSDSV